MNTLQQVEKLTQYFVRQLSGPAHLLWSIYMRQAIITGVEWAVGAAMAGITALVVFRGWRRWTADDDGGATAGLGILLGVAIVLGIISIFQALQWLGNPAFQAARMLLHGGS